MRIAYDLNVLMRTVNTLDAFSTAFPEIGASLALVGRQPKSTSGWTEVSGWTELQPSDSGRFLFGAPLGTKSSRFKIPKSGKAVENAPKVLIVRMGTLRSYAIFIELFHMTSRPPYWFPKTIKRRPCWCPKPVLWELNYCFIAFYILAGHVSENALLLSHHQRIFNLRLGSLSKAVFDWRTSTGSETILLIIWLDAIKFVLLSLFILLEIILPQIWAHRRPRMIKVHYWLTCVAQKRLC